MITTDSDRLNLAVLARERGMNPRTLQARVNGGMTIEDALACPVADLGTAKLQFKTSARAAAVHRLYEVQRKVASVKRVLERYPRDVKANARYACLAAELVFLQGLLEPAKGSADA